MLMFFSGSAFSQTVNICGTVTDQNGNPLTHTIVRLGQTTYDNGYWKATPYLATSDANGNYQLGSGTCPPPSAIKNISCTKENVFSQPTYVAGKVYFSLPASETQVKMNLYDMSGRLVRELINKNLSKGNYTVAIDARGISSQFYLLRVTIQGTASVLKLQPTLKVSRSAHVNNASEFQTKLEKLAAIVDTIRATEPGYTIGATPVSTLIGHCDFKLTKNNAWNGNLAAFWGDTSKYPRAGSTPQYIILNRTNGAWPDSKIYWSHENNGTKIPITQTNMKPLQNERLYIYVAPLDSQSRYNDFLEVNSGGTNWAGNTTRVDGWRLPITFRLKTTTGIDTIMGDSYELFFQSRQSKFDEFKNEVPKEFTWEATHDFANIYAPHKMDPFPFRTGQPYADYFKRYQDSAVAHYVKNPAWAQDPGPLTPVTQADDIFACTGNSIGSSPDWSSAINRHVALLPQGVQYENWRFKDTASYYHGTPCNYFSYWCHRRSINNYCYGYPYDDDGAHEAYINIGNVQWIAVAIGW
jgi:hypothetical protein